MTSRRRRITCWTAVWSRRARSRRIPPLWSRRWQCCSRSWRIRRQTPPDADEDDVPWETGTVIDVRMPQERAVNDHTEVVEGQKCLVIPLTGDESARINGVEVE